VSTRPRLTYLDANVLISAAKGTEENSLKALAIIDDPDREFVASQLLRLEVLPKATYYKWNRVADFYNEFFGRVKCWAEIDDHLVDAACTESGKTNLGAMDALHIVSASSSGAMEFVTFEDPRSPFGRTTLDILVVFP